MTFENKLVERFLEKLKEQDDRAIELMAAGMLQDFGEYRHAGGYRKALADAKKLITETLEDLMKE